MKCFKHANIMYDLSKKGEERSQAIKHETKNNRIIA